MDIAEEKRKLRREVRERKALLSEAWREDASRTICRRIEALPEFARAKVVLAYCSLQDEVGTGLMLQRWVKDKIVALPVVKGDILELRRYEPEHIVAGFKGISEPSDEAALILPEDVDFAVIPGLAFDASGRRLGRGGGFYDRLLPQLQCPVAGVCFSCQIFPEIPVEPFDFRVGLVISE